ncbi:MAG TPA: PKD domain-containing protein [Anaerolineales bacterium]|nr:PKD domain-containing protein [Anaerolineales bacterium]
MSTRNNPQIGKRRGAKPRRPIQAIQLVQILASLFLAGLPPASAFADRGKASSSYGDSVANTNRAEVAANVPSRLANRAPTANAGPDQTTTSHSTVTLSGAASADPDGDALAFAWRQLSGPSVDLNGAKDPQPSFEAPHVDAPSAVIVELTVTDPGGLSATDSVTITISGHGAGNRPPTANAGPDLSVVSGSTINLDGSGSSDPDGDVLSFAWRQIGGPSGELSNAQQSQATFKAPRLDSPAEIVIELVVSDSGGLSATDTLTVRVGAGEQDGGGQFDPRKIPVELQVWWQPLCGHTHVTANLPLGQEVAGILTFDLRIVMHENACRLHDLLLENENGERVGEVSLRDGLGNPMACPNNGICAFNVPVSLDTARLGPNGWHLLSLRVVRRYTDGVPPDEGLEYLASASEIPLLVRNAGQPANSKAPYFGFELLKLKGQGWFSHVGFASAEVIGVPITPVSGAITFWVRAADPSQHLNVVLDKTHFIPAVGPWPEVPASPGKVLLDAGSDYGDLHEFFPVTIDTTSLSNGWHSLGVRSANPNDDQRDVSLAVAHELSGTAKFWFFVQNNEPGAGAPQLSFSAEPAIIRPGESSRLTWSANNASGCTASAGWAGDKGSSGNATVSPNASARYELACRGPQGSVTKHVTVAVLGKADQPQEFLRLESKAYQSWALSGDKFAWLEFLETRPGPSPEFGDSTLWQLKLFDFSTNTRRDLTVVNDPQGYTGNSLAMQGGLIAYTKTDLNNTAYPDTDLYLFDLSTSSERQFASRKESNESAPAIWDSYVAYIDDAHGELPDVVLYSALSDSRWLITAQPDAYPKSGPALAGDERTLYMVWQDGRHGQDEVYLSEFDRATARSTEVRITNHPGSQASPSIGVHDGQVFVLWEDWRNQTCPAMPPDGGENLCTSGSDVFFCVYDPTSRSCPESRLTSSTRSTTYDSYIRYAPRISWPFVIWGDYRNGSIDAYLYDLASKTERPLLPTIVHEYVATVDSGRAVVGSTDFSGLTTFFTFELASAQPSQPKPVFGDVPFEHWANRYIEALYRNRLVAGCSANPLQYCPEERLTRAAAAVFVVRGVRGADLLPPEPNPAELHFADLEAGAWYLKWVQQLWLDGYTAGCGQDPLGRDRFCPSQPHTRAEATVLFLRMLNGAGYQPPEGGQLPYRDVNSGVWYHKWVAAAYAAGLVQDCEDGANRGDDRFRPEEAISRAEAACMMAKAKSLPLP